MVELIIHSLGLCSEPHPNFIGILINEVGFNNYFSYIVSKLKILK